MDRAFDIDEKTRLVEFYLRDIAKGNRKDTNYIDKVPLNNRYRRVSPNKSSTKQRNIYHDER